jgi:hypothetical protein
MSDRPETGQQERLSLEGLRALIDRQVLACTEPGRADGDRS